MTDAEIKKGINEAIQSVCQAAALCNDLILKINNLLPALELKRPAANLLDATEDATSETKAAAANLCELFRMTEEGAPEKYIKDRINDTGEIVKTLDAIQKRAAGLTE